MTNPPAPVRIRFRPWLLAAVAVLWTVILLGFLFRFAELPSLTAYLGRLWRGPLVQLQIRAVWMGFHLVGLGLCSFLLARRLGVSATDLGLSFSALRNERNRIVWITCGCLPIVLALSFVPAFQRAYPMFRSSESGVFVTLLWLAIYALYLFSIELYFRGFLLALLSPLGGGFAVGIAMIPYVLTHRFGPEIVGSVPVGILLGIWRQRCGSIIPGLLTHLLIATEIELCGLWQLHR